jgi:hypothetical protein
VIAKTNTESMRCSTRLAAPLDVEQENVGGTTLTTANALTSNHLKLEQRGKLAERGSVEVVFAEIQFEFKNIDITDCYAG